MTNLRTLAVLMLIALSVTGCSRSDDSSAGSRPKAPVAASGPMSGPTGEVVRTQLLLLSATDLDAPRPEPIAFEFGAKSGRCTNVDPEPERDRLIAAVTASDDDAPEVDLSNPEVLVADCGDVHVAIAKWGSTDTTISIDEFKRTDGGEWSATEGDHYPPCGLPRDVLALWKLTGVTC